MPQTIFEQNSIVLESHSDFHDLLNHPFNDTLAYDSMDKCISVYIREREIVPGIHWEE